MGDNPESGVQTSFPPQQRRPAKRGQKPPQKNANSGTKSVTVKSQHKWRLLLKPRFYKMFSSTRGNSSNRGNNDSIEIDIKLLVSNGVINLIVILHFCILILYI